MSSRGMCKEVVPAGVLILFACATGCTASDGLNGSLNGVFTGALLKVLKLPDVSGMDLDILARLVTVDVSETTNGKHTRWSRSLVLCLQLQLPPAELVQQMRHGMRRCGPASMFRPGAAGDQ